jgi:RimJ/RimL family protein N-acetyltransferase
VNHDALICRKLYPGEEPIYRGFRVYALARYPESFTSTSAEAAARSLDWYAQRVAAPGDPRNFLIGAFEGGRLIGTAGLSGGDRESERHKAVLYGMAVHEDYTGRGIGKQLVRELINGARAIPGLMQITLSLTKGNTAAERRYRTCGFEPYGCEPRATFINGAYHDKLLMVLPLG